MSGELEVRRDPPRPLAHKRLSAVLGGVTQPWTLKVKREGRLGIGALSPSRFPIARGLRLSDA